MEKTTSPARHDFFWEGVIPSSKSSFNRALIIQSYGTKIKINGVGTCDDIENMRNAIMGLTRRETVFECGEAGTVLRFLALRVAREKGTFLLQGHQRLFRRPQTELLQIFSQLQVRYQMESRGMRIESAGWKIPSKPLKVSARESSQFVSGIMLNAWDLPEALQLEIPTKIVSSGYFALTLQILKEFGMEWEQKGNLFLIPPRQKPKSMNYQVESDVSSAFAVAGLATVSGEARIQQFPFESLQPDLAFVPILKSMGAHLEREDQTLIVKRVNRLKGLAINLRDCPDLFPVLAALCARAEGESILFGAPQLKFKESNRIIEVATVLKKLGLQVEAQDDGIIINGIANGIKDTSNTLVIFDTQDDHRLAMMGAVLKASGFLLKIEKSDSVNKSFPEFKELAQGYL